MTLVLTVLGRETIFVVTDRRLTYPGNRHADDAIKVASLQTVDGVAAIAYAGLGATAAGVQPSEWIARVLRGRGNLGIEASLGVLADAATRELPSHLVGMPGGMHSFVIPALISNGAPRLYTIDNVVDASGRQHLYRFTRIVRELPGQPAPRICLGGTGGVYLSRRLHQFDRSLLNLVNANGRGRVSDLAVADFLARLNFMAHRGVTDRSVGPRCVVMWRKAAGGGGHQFYTATTREWGDANIPAIARGLDVNALADATVPFLSRLPHLGSDGVERTLLEKQMRKRLELLPTEPDEELR